jgi:hypothetical protein
VANVPEEELILITDNRNKNDPDSLEATIQSRNTLTSLPVFTIANVPHLRASRPYADRVIELRRCAAQVDFTCLEGKQSTPDFKPTLTGSPPVIS